MSEAAPAEDAPAGEGATEGEAAEGEEGAFEEEDYLEEAGEFGEELDYEGEEGMEGEFEGEEEKIGEAGQKEGSFEHIEPQPTEAAAKEEDASEAEQAIEEGLEKKAKELVGEVIDVRRESFVDIPGAPKVARFQNTYKMEPDKPYNPEKVLSIIKTVLEEAFEAYTAFRTDEEGELTDMKYYLPYNPDLCVKQAKWVSETVRNKVKELQFSRYKIIVIATMGEKHNQDVFCCARFLWDIEKDNYNYYSMENPYIYGYAIVFGLYYQ
ncbi:unnamed protein product [Phyllotreta striolata]|uniref:Uncharacterized protein n=1 Tax=Phyllotreta striolata TaxID=444603 RepID=A0A9N9TAF9_PHYSR|nr:unnamed protein product [Phyllotreta striolata]